MPAAGFTANAIPRGQCQLLHVTCRVEAMEGKAPYSSEYTADAVRDSRQGVVLQLGRKTDSSSLCNSCKLQNVARGFKINKRRVFVKAVMNIHIPKKCRRIYCAEAIGRSVQDAAKPLKHWGLVFQSRFRNIFRLFLCCFCQNMIWKVKTNTMSD